MSLPNTAHTSKPWRIHELTADFRLEDVWALPPGGPDDFPRLVRLIASGDPSTGSSCAVRTLFAIRWKVGELLGWDGLDTGHSPTRPTLRDRLPVDLRDTSSGLHFDALPFTALYLIDDECAAEIVNRTVHGVLHIGWVPDQTGGHHGQMAVLVSQTDYSGPATWPRSSRPTPDRLPNTDTTDRAGVACGHSRGILARRPEVTLPPGQRPIDGFPRFGTHLARHATTFSPDQQQRACQRRYGASMPEHRAQPNHRRPPARRIRTSHSLCRRVVRHQPALGGSRSRPSIA